MPIGEPKTKYNRRSRYERDLLSGHAGDFFRLGENGRYTTSRREPLLLLLVGIRPPASRLYPPVDNKSIRGLVGSYSHMYKYSKTTHHHSMFLLDRSGWVVRLPTPDKRQTTSERERIIFPDGILQFSVRNLQ